MFGIENIVKQNKPPKSAEEHAADLLRSKNLVRTETIQDRTAWITEPVYDAVKNGPNAGKWLYYQSGVALFRSCLIYCRPPLDVIKQNAGKGGSPPDTYKHLLWVVENIEAMVEYYDLFMEGVQPALVYDWTRGDDKLDTLAISIERSKTKALIRGESKAAEPRPLRAPTFSLDGLK
jgi:hypothetical protein